MSRLNDLSRLSRGARLKAGCGIALIAGVIVLAIGLPWCSGLVRSALPQVPWLQPDASATTRTWSFDPSTVTGLDIEDTADDVEITNGDTANGGIEVTATHRRDAPAPSCAVEDGTLRIDRHPRRSHRGFQSDPLQFLWSRGTGRGATGDERLRVRLPPEKLGAARLDHVKVSAGASDCRLDGVSCGSCELSITAGDLKVDGLSTDHLSLDATSGSIRMRGTVAEELGIKLTAGKVTAVCESSAPRSLTCSLTTGEATIELPADTGFTAHVETTLGDFSTDFKTSDRRDEHGRSRVLRTGDGSASIEARLTVGKMRLMKTGAGDER
ncbi:hypothetical protein Corgl_1358 [Coriobacterium glomerans PW2]|uniref:DUF4097 domain-containing protein n=1 Tax=Coriobacterium glomerans (strain ATCC 49209 / DSM 20642 / JCM 10262 / PW2) TaxID=700015 RepID=F2N8S6_CORGP|nr:DUF4097 family beta strand repeat-containing protein [Coriobacterium glomerans]AEB07459.1 hypothetical protein Corgl_1358 [Coriobacterium glomerans PW2]